MGSPGKPDLKQNSRIIQRAAMGYGGLIQMLQVMFDYTIRRCDKETV